MNLSAIMLSRVAAHLYWAGRQLMRAEDTSRVVLAYNDISLTAQHQNIADWKNLLSALEENAPNSGESGALRHLLAARTNPNSVRTCVYLARENMRVARSLLPEEIWGQITQLHEAIETAPSHLYSRRHRVRQLRDIVMSCRAIIGVLLTSLRRGGTRTFLNIGILLECADMNCRLLRYAMPDDGQDDDPAQDSVRWRRVLDAFGLTNMYRGGGYGSIRRESAVDFIIADTAMPRSMLFCLVRLQTLLAGLPNNTKALEECSFTLRSARTMRGGQGDIAAQLERTQNQLVKLHAIIAQTYFLS